MKNKHSQDHAYEEDILHSFERDEFTSVPSLKEEIARYSSIATATLTKDKRINIRLSSRDLEDIQVRAAEEGIPYQTLIASVLHKYVTGRLVERHAAVTTMRTGAKKLRTA